MDKYLTLILIISIIEKIVNIIKATGEDEFDINIKRLYFMLVGGMYIVAISLIWSLKY